MYLFQSVWLPRMKNKLLLLLSLLLHVVSRAEVCWFVYHDTKNTSLYHGHTSVAYLYDWCLFSRPYGRIDFRINLPMRPLLWVIGAFSLHQERGLAFAEYPIRVSTCYLCNGPCIVEYSVTVSTCYLCNGPCIAENSVSVSTCYLR